MGDGGIYIIVCVAAKILYRVQFKQYRCVSYHSMMGGVKAIEFGSKLGQRYPRLLTKKQMYCTRRSLFNCG